MGYWEILENRDEYSRGSAMKDEVEEAYREGCRHGYEKAMREAKGGMGFRDGGGYGYGNRGGEGSGMGERRMMPPYYPESPMGFRDPYMDDDMGERRRRRSNGRFY